MQQNDNNNPPDLDFVSASTSEQLGAKKLDVEVLMQRIREDVKAECRSNGDLNLFSPTLKAESSSRLPLIHREELNSLNASWHSLLAPEPIQSHRKLFGPLIVRVKQFVVNTVWNYLLKGYFEREKQFHMHLVRHLNDTARYIDARDSDMLAQAVARLEVERSSTNLNSPDSAKPKSMPLELGITRVRERLEQLETDRDQLIRLARDSSKDVLEMDDVLRGLEQTVALIGKATSPESKVQLLEEQALYRRSGANATQGLRVLNNGVDRLISAERLSGPVEKVQQRFRNYLQFFERAQGPILHLESGRGEMLELLREVGLEALGTESDQASAMFSRERGSNVIFQDATEYLEQVAENSLGGIFISQFLERLDPASRTRLVGLMATRLPVGAPLVVELLNVQSLSVLVDQVYRDPQLTHPLHHEAVRLLLESLGFEVERVEFLDPFAPEEKLQFIETSEVLPARWSKVIRDVNSTVQQLNDRLFGPQFCAVIARRTNASLG